MNVLVVRDRGDYDPITRDEWLWIWGCQYTVPVPQENAIFATMYMAVYGYYVRRAQAAADRIVAMMNAVNGS